MLQDIKLAARAAERLFGTDADTPAGRLRFAGLLALSAVLNLVVVYGLVLATLIEGPDLQVVAEIPVEIVPEQPPQQEQPQPPPEPAQQKQEEKQQPAPPPQALDEAPATDAPKAQSDAKQEREASEQQKAPREAPPADQAATSPTPDREQTAALRPADTPPAAQQPQLTEPEAETIENAAPPSQSNAEPNARAPVEAPPSKGATSVQDLAAAFAPLPEYEFDSSAMKTPVTGGRARSTYLTVLYGMIMPRMRMPDAAAQRPLIGVVSFVVDEWGHVARIGVSKASGSQQLDMAAMAAIKSAAPFPPPPRHLPIGLNFSYGSKRTN